MVSPSPLDLLRLTYVCMYISLFFYQSINHTIHAGAYFGLAVSKIITPEDMVNRHLDRENKASVDSDMFAMIGTLFLFIYWPSFKYVHTYTHACSAVDLHTYIHAYNPCLLSWVLDRGMIMWIPIHSPLLYCMSYMLYIHIYTTTVEVS